MKYDWFLIRSTGERNSRKIILKRIRMEHIIIVVHKHIYNEINDDDQFDYVMTVVIFITTTTSFFHQ